MNENVLTIDTRRVRRLLISWRLLPQLFTEGEHRYSVAHHAVPNDAQVLRIEDTGGEAPGTVGIVLYSASFDIVGPGERIPFIEPVLTID